METGKLLQADYLDIIYDHRNKKYGGYELRRTYEQRLKRGVIGIFSVVAAVCCLSFAGTNAPAERSRNERTICPVIAEIKPRIIPEQKMEQPHAQPKPIATVKNVVPVITKERIDPDDEMKPNSDVADRVSGLQNSTGDTAGIVSDLPEKKGLPEVPASPGLPPLKPLIYVEQMPQFAGDMNAYIGGELKYPEVARSNGIQGRVVVQFVVNEDGAVTDALVMRGIGGGCDEEALRVVNAMPHWKPGRQNGKPVKVLFTLPLRFELR